jgi:hypothetical protein
MAMVQMNTRENRISTNSMRRTLVPVILLLAVNVANRWFPTAC